MTRSITMKFTWEAAVRIHLAVLNNDKASPEAHHNAHEEILRLAQHMDKINTMLDEGKLKEVDK
jgi:hypothetical protein